MRVKPPSPKQKRILKVFVASPSDVARERAALEKVVNEINLTLSLLAPEAGLGLELIRWETHSPPGVDVDPQAVTNLYLPADYDVFIGIMWRRIGTKTHRADSGTIEEFKAAYDRWEKRRDLPLLFYFCRRSIDIPKSPEELAQLRKVVKFHGDLSKKALVSEYEDPSVFADLVRPHLLLVLHHHFLDRSSQAPALPQVSNAQAEWARRALNVLALEYEELRARLSVGTERTQLMVGIFSRMRAHCITALPIVEEFMKGETGGERLCAVAILQGAPQPAYIQWLAERAEAENWFVGYQAATALYRAVRGLPTEEDKLLASALDRALQLARGREPLDPKQIAILKNASRELKEKSPLRSRRPAARAKGRK